MNVRATTVMLGVIVVLAITVVAVVLTDDPPIVAPPCPAPILDPRGSTPRLAP